MPIKRVKQIFDFPPNTPLAPANGKKYTPEDLGLVFKQQPFEGKLPDPLYPVATSTLRPPLMRYAWQIPGGYDRFMQVIFDHFPEIIDKWQSTEPVQKDTALCAQVPDQKDWVMDTLSTVHAPPLTFALCKYLEIPADRHVLFYVGFFEDNAGNGALGLAVGSNYQGILSTPLRGKLKELFGLSEDPKWYLDLQRWKWGRVPPRKSHPKAPSSDSSQSSQ